MSMGNAQKQVLDLLKSSGAKLVRERKHGIWQLPDGRRYTLPATPSDHHSWKNNLSKLKWFLGQKTKQEKTHADFEHKKKDKTYKIKRPPRREFLADLPPREARPPTPISESPLVTIKKRMLEEQLNQALAARAAADGKVIPPYVYGARKARKEETGRTGRVMVLGPEVKAEAQFLLETKGQEAVSAFLNSKKAGHEKNDEQLWREAMEGVRVIEHKDEKEELPTQPPQEVANAVTTALNGGSIDDLLKKHKDLMQRFKWEENKAHIEYLRNAKIVEALEQVAKLVLAPLATAKQMLEGQKEEPLVRVDGNNDKQLFNWKPTFKEIILTSPTPLTRRQLTLEASSATGREYAQAYQSMIYFLKKGTIVEDQGGNLSWNQSQE